MIEAQNLHVGYDAPVLTGATFEVEPGEVAALVGNNGTGKTTLLRVLSGHLTPDRGTARIQGIDVARQRQAARQALAFLPQETRFHEALTPRQVLRFYAGLRDRPDAPISDLLDEVGLADVAGRSCGALSGGMRQRLGLAVVQLAQAPVVLLDEPGLSLDPGWRSHLCTMLERWAARGASVLMATHYPEAWTRAVDTFLCCEGGQVRRADASTASCPTASTGSETPDHSLPTEPTPS